MLGSLHFPYWCCFAIQPTPQDSKGFAILGEFLHLGLSDKRKDTERVGGSLWNTSPVAQWLPCVLFVWLASSEKIIYIYIDNR